MNYRVNIKTGDEIETLATSFYKMIASLQESQEKIRAQNTMLNHANTKLEESNKGLRKITSELSRSNEELKVLKEQVEKEKGES